MIGSAPRALRFSVIGDLDAQVAEGVDRDHIAGRGDGGRGVLLDDRRPGDALARAELIAPVRGGVHPAAVEVDGALAGERLARSVPRLDPRRLRLHDGARDRGADAHDFGRLGLGAVAVALGVDAVEVALDLGCVARVEGGRRDVERGRVLLADVAHVERAAHRDRADRGRGGAHVALAFALQLAKERLEALEVEVGERDEEGLHEVAAEIGDQHPVRREVPWRGRHDHPADVQLARDEGRVQRPGAAERDHREVARVEAAVGRHALHDARHRRRRDPHDAVGGLLDGKTQGLGDLAANRVARALEVEPHLAAEKAGRREPPEHEVRVGDGGRRAAEPIADRARLRARALRPHAERPRRADARDAAAAGADLLDGDHRELHRQALVVAADHRVRGHQHLAVEDHAGLRGGAAHVERDRLVEADRVAERARADHARRGPGFEHADALALRLSRLVEAAGRLHDEERAVEAFIREMRFDLAEVGLHPRADVGVGRHRGGALELPVLLRELVRGRDVGVREAALEEPLRCELVRGIAVAVKEEDRDRVDALRGDDLARALELGLGERPQHLARARHPLVDLEAERALDERHVLAEEEVVCLRAVDAPDLVDVAEAAGRDERSPSAVPLEERVDRDRRAVEEEVRSLERPARLPEAGADAAHDTVIRRQRLAEEERAVRLVEDGDVGERAADVGGDAQRARFVRGGAPDRPRVAQLDPPRGSISVYPTLTPPRAPSRVTRAYAPSRAATLGRESNRRRPQEMKSMRIIAAAAFALAAGMFGAAQAQTELKFADGLPKTFAYWGAMEEFKKVVEGKTKTLVVNLFGAGVLGDQKALMEATKVGAVDICVVASQVSQQLVPEHGVFGLPFAWIKNDDWLKFLQGPIAGELGKKMEAHGLKVLTLADGGSLAVLNSKRPVKTPDDMKGLKLRVMQDPMQVDMIKAMGAIPVPMGTPEVYTAIQQGQIDGNATGPQLLWALKNHEVAKYLSFTNHGRAAAVVMMNLKKWNAMTPEQKAALDEGSKAFFWADSAYFTSNPNTANDRVVGFMAQSGVVVTEPDIQAFRKSTTPVVQAFKARVKSPLVDQALKDAGYE